MRGSGVDRVRAIFTHRPPADALQSIFIHHIEYQHIPTLAEFARSSAVAAAEYVRSGLPNIAIARHVIDPRPPTPDAHFQQSSLALHCIL